MAVNDTASAIAIGVSSCWANSFHLCSWSRSFVASYF